MDRDRGFPWWGDYLAIALAMGILAGFGQVSLTLTGQTLLGQIAGLGQQMIWMTPAATALGFLCLALPFVAAAGLWNAARSVRIVIGVFAGLAFLNLSLLIPGLHLVSDLMLSAGVGMVTIRFAAGRMPRLARSARIIASVGAVGILVLAVVMQGAAWWHESRSIGRLPPVRPGAPNVLLLSLDTVRRASCSVYGYSALTTPVLEEWGGRGIIFQHAIATAPWTLASHASVFTGRLPHETSVGWSRPLDGTWPVLAEVVRDHGYLTAGFVANLSYLGTQYGLGRGFIHYEDFPVNVGELLVSSKLLREIVNSRLARRLTGFDDFFARKSALELNDDFLDWLKRHRQRPFFAFLNYFDAHEPYLPPPGLDSLFASPVPRQNDLIVHELHQGERSEKEQMTPAERAREREAYEASIAFIDASLGQLFDTLSAWGVLENTVVVVFSDHGELFGEHGKFTHGNSLYREAIEVPLVMFGAGLPSGLTPRETVSLADLPATILDLIDVRDPRLPGVSLVRGDLSGRRPAISELYGQGRKRVSLMDQQLHLIWVNGDSMRLYDWQSDPREERNLFQGSQAPRDALSMLERIHSSGATGGQR